MCTPAAEGTCVTLRILHQQNPRCNDRDRFKPSTLRLLYQPNRTAVFPLLYYYCIVFILCVWAPMDTQLIP